MSYIDRAFAGILKELVETSKCTLLTGGETGRKVNFDKA